MSSDPQCIPNNTIKDLSCKKSNKKKRRALYRSKKRRELATQSSEPYDPLAEWTDNQLNGHSYFYRKSKYTTIKEAIKWLKPDPNAKPPRANLNVNAQPSKGYFASSRHPRTRVALPPPRYDSN